MANTFRKIRPLVPRPGVHAALEKATKSMGYEQRPGDKESRPNKQGKANQCQSAHTLIMKTDSSALFPIPRRSTHFTPSLLFFRPRRSELIPWIETLQCRLNRFLCNEDPYLRKI